MVMRVLNSYYFHCMKANILQVKYISSKHEKFTTAAKYIGKESSRVKRLKFVTLASSLAATSFVPVMAVKSTVGITLVTSAFLPITYLCSFAVYFATKAYVTEMYLKSTDELVVKKLNLLCKTVTHKIDPKDIEIPIDLGMFESFRVNGKGYFVDDEAIQDPELYKCISGFRSKEKSEIKYDGK